MHSDVVPLFQLLDMAQALAGHYTGASKQTLWAFHQEVLMGAGAVMVRGDGDALEHALRIHTDAGMRLLDMHGRVHDTIEETWMQGAWGDDTHRRHLHSRTAIEGLLGRTGIGLEFRCANPGQALDEERVIEALWSYSCHPYIGRAIVHDLTTRGVRCATVMPRLLDLMDSLRTDLAELGVVVRRCRPMPSRGERAIPASEPAPHMPLRPRGLGMR